jgi:hypothetical protein
MRLTPKEDFFILLACSALAVGYIHGWQLPYLTVTLHMLFRIYFNR